uniref:Putative secreted peptide n=1 Tax=Anopheles braziliensis TaxID=58242 RepID=A0A2M3ZVG8_9DIPT
MVAVAALAVAVMAVVVEALSFGCSCSPCWPIQQLVLALAESNHTSPYPSQRGLQNRVEAHCSHSRPNP